MRRAPQARRASRPATNVGEARVPGPSPLRANRIAHGEAWLLQKTAGPQSRVRQQLREFEEPCSGDRTACPHPILGRIYSRIVPSPFERARPGGLELKLQHQTGATQGCAAFRGLSTVGRNVYNLPHPPPPGVSILIRSPLAHRVLNLPGMSSTDPSSRTIVALPTAPLSPSERPHGPRECRSAKRVTSQSLSNSISRTIPSPPGNLPFPPLAKRSE